MRGNNNIRRNGFQESIANVTGKYCLFKAKRSSASSSSSPFFPILPMHTNCWVVYLNSAYDRALYSYCDVCWGIFIHMYRRWKKMTTTTINHVLHEESLHVILLEKSLLWIYHCITHSIKIDLLNACIRFRVLLIHERREKTRTKT